MRRLMLPLAAVSLLGLAPPAWAADPQAGQAIFEGACADCHAAGSPRVLSGQPLLPRTRPIRGDDPTRAIGLILHGRQPPPERRGAWMPGYADMLSDAQIADVLAWLREAAGAPPWPDLTQRVRQIRAAPPPQRREAAR